VARSKSVTRRKSPKKNFGEASVKLSNNNFLIKYIPEREGSLEDHIDCLSCSEPSSFRNDDATNYAIGNELSESNEFRLDHLNKEESNALTKILHKFRDIQYTECQNLTFTSTVKHVIKTKHEDPIYRKPYKYPQAYDNEVELQIKEMIQKGIVPESDSPYCLPICIVPKKSDDSGKTKFRIVIDYRKLNEITIDDKYPIAVMDEILELQPIFLCMQVHLQN